MSSYLSYTRGIRDKPIDTVAAVYFLQLSIADFVFWGLHLLIQTNNNLLSISVAKAMKVFILADTIYIAGVSGQCNIVYLCVCACGVCVYIYILIFISSFSEAYRFCKGAKPTDFTCTLHSYMHFLEYVLTDVLQYKYKGLIYTAPMHPYVWMACLYEL